MGPNWTWNRTRLCWWRPAANYYTALLCSAPSVTQSLNPSSQVSTWLYMWFMIDRSTVAPDWRGPQFIIFDFCGVLPEAWQHKNTSSQNGSLNGAHSRCTCVGNRKQIMFLSYLASCFCVMILYKYASVYNSVDSLYTLKLSRIT